MAEFVFNRYEKKYLLTEPVYQQLRRKLEPYMGIDQYGLHTICNIYYDTEDSELIRRSIEKTAYKEKLRLRSYGIPQMDTTVYLEIKKKYKGIVNKRRTAMTLAEAYAYVEQGIHPAMDGQILREIDFFLQRYPLERKLYLAYDRIAMAGYEDSGFRVTFDHNIRSRRKNMGLEAGDEGKHLLPPGYYLMESKVLGATPLWFAQILSELAIYPTSFSKYGNIYRDGYGKFHVDQMMQHYQENWKMLQRRKDIC